MMTLETFQNFFNQRFLKRTKNNDNCIWTGNALGGELGEVQNLLKKKDFYSLSQDYRACHDAKVLMGEKQDFEDALEDEMGDTLYYFLKLVYLLDLNLEKIAIRQLEKLEEQDKRFGRYFQK